MPRTQSTLSHVQQSASLRGLVFGLLSCSAAFCTAEDQTTRDVAELAECMEHEECPYNAARCRCDVTDQLRMVEFEHDEDLDGVVDEREIEFFDSDGQITRRETDFEPDGEIDEIQYFFYNENGELLRSELDADADGSVDITCVFEPPCPEPHTCDPSSCAAPAQEE